ncbi:Tn7 transposase TnsA N-terminal domain-containing protein [Hansschlegelia quercus]|uniref:TnsA endonuclease N-terminal domain-containing protein n=1 Tax=Hansschlegelia quercus TaxID=2528245 RepID=A0A4Q9GNV8_9HYPH|nr:hypothetical protein [Hansschlegelia quercus]TBN54464.1 hypothetical protein EYR15_06440 [Hansschlegelia quercus]
MPAFTPKHLLDCPDTQTFEVFAEPLPSRASRFPALKSKGSSRGEIYCASSGRIIVYESALERRAAVICLASPDVVDIWDQPPPVIYTIGAGGIERRHTFDFRLVLKNSCRIAVAVKPYERAIATCFFHHMRLIARQLDRSFADKVVVLTERELDPIAVQHAELVLIARRSHDPEADAAIQHVAASLIGAVSVNQLVDRTGLQGRGFYAIARAIGIGMLQPVSYGPLCGYTMVKSLVSEGRL